MVAAQNGIDFLLHHFTTISIFCAKIQFLSVFALKTQLFQLMFCTPYTAISIGIFAELFG